MATTYLPTLLRFGQENVCVLAVEALPCLECFADALQARRNQREIIAETAQCSVCIPGLVVSPR